MPDTALDAAKLYSSLQSEFPSALARFDEPMSRHTTFGVGGPVRVMFFPACEEELAALIGLCRARDIKPLIVGNGSNLLCSDGPMELVAVKLRSLAGIRVEGGNLYCGAGALLREAAECAASAGLAGMEFAHGIPGSVGGAAYMNAGAYGGEMSGIISAVRAISSAGEISDIPAGELGYAYRTSRFENTDEIITGARFTLKEGDERLIREKMRELAQKRVEKQPLDKPSAGSTFKRPASGYAAAMIDGAGLKGFGFGGARVSEKHAGFVVNEGGATCEDILKTMRAVRERVYARYGVLLEPEVRIIGAQL